MVLCCNFQRSVDGGAITAVRRGQASDPRQEPRASERERERAREERGARRRGKRRRNRFQEIAGLAVFLLLYMDGKKDTVKGVDTEPSFDDVKHAHTVLVRNHSAIFSKIDKSPTAMQQVYKSVMGCMGRLEVT